MLTHEAFPGERQNLIAERLATHGRVLAGDLAQEFNVSEHSIRRDLAALAEAGICKRVYGGAISVAPVRGGDHAQADRKSSLGLAAAALIKSGQHIFIDGGTTNASIASAIDHNLAVSITTNSPAIALEMQKLPLADVILLGGRLHKATGSTVGLTAIQQLSNFNFDLCFLGACAIDAVKGVTAFDMDDAEFKRTVVSRSGQIVVAATNEKLSSIAHYQVASCEELGVLVVEKDAPAERLGPIQAKVSNIVVAS
ncbi:DeoR family transcriptional regulator [Pseudomonas sp. 478]|uniref:DeoR/GlpR family DNA-binding transcription regulator n=1 Tax=unclassified Pseudomonas TaxID=196821 RepID=UPI000DAC62E5|nr:MULTISPECIES: DeoR/GlpR family DNA-binding transcription regulator [unclassified Pseudomonas]PZW98089.1 DeoR family transcriptional regulator [Pseudomonas sp. 478]TCV56693.1 DeoR family transcriptional regulator [Pseudomonas sp. 460]